MEKASIVTAEKENNTLFVIETICAFLVIEIHAKLFFANDFLTEYLLNISRIAVPFFFVISGYFLWNPDKNAVHKKIVKRFRRNLSLLFWVLIFYICLNIMMNGWGQFVKNITPENLIKFIILNWSTPFCGCGHLWFLMALLYDYIIMSVVNSFNIYRIGYFFAVIVLAAVYIIELVSCLFHFSVSEIYLRNFFSLGFPLIMLGNLMGKYKDKMLSEISNNKGFILLKVFFASLFLLFCETLLFGNHMFVFLGTYLLCFFLMLFSMAYPKTRFKMPILVFSGKHCVKWIYIFHYAIILILNKISINGNGVFLIVTCCAVGYILIHYIFIQLRINLCK